MINFGSRPFSNQTQIKENKINNTNISLINVKRQKKEKENEQESSVQLDKAEFKYSAVFLASAFFSLTLYPLQGDQLAGILTSSPSSPCI